MKQRLQLWAVASFTAMLICLFIAIERYQANLDDISDQAEEYDRLTNISRIGSAGYSDPIMREQRLKAQPPPEPFVPATSKYAVFFAILFAGAGTSACWRLRALTPSEVLPPQPPSASGTPPVSAGEVFDRSSTS